MRGGKRQGAGRPKGSTMQKDKKRKTVSVCIPLWLAQWLSNHPESSGRLVERALITTYNIKEPKKTKPRARQGQPKRCDPDTLPVTTKGESEGLYGNPKKSKQENRQGVLAD